MENKDDEFFYQHCSNTENEQRGCEDDAIGGETNEEPEYDIQEPSDAKHVDSGLEGLCILDGKKQAEENEWLKDLYNLREKWAQIYGRSNFVQNLILCEWVVHYERALVDRREKKRLAEVATTQRKRKLLSNWKVEVEAAKMYTKASFNCFQEEFRKCLDLILELESDDGRIETYVVQRPGNPNLRRSVIYSPSNQSVNCSCKRFQFEGILCAHALKLFRELGLSTLPSKYYLKRWRRDARQGIDFECYGQANFSDRSASSALQYSHLSHIAQRIVAKGANDKQSPTLVESKLLALEAELDGNLSIGQEHETNGDIDSDDQVNENNTNLVLRDPKVKRHRRRGKGKRNNDLGSNKQSKKRSSSVRQEQEDGPVPPKEKNVSVSKKMKAPSKRKDSQEPNSYEHEKSGPSNSYEHVQEQEDAPVPPKEQNVSVSKKRKAPSKRKC
ncbi:protein FAR1-RELATED SEQUENCE 5-like [Rosa rugosa]|uniref:protein FAR1-RELATED SEQUENCE 5-like n=1 Tax=Rosa rugosa TaxID=74645 RepID=UPI002B404CD1|nr:protein FAR1-RELATED SEQUENCE 5-like [Rosa rugosa]